MRVILRLNEKKDKDLIEYLSNCKNVSKGVRTAMRRGITVNIASISVEESKPPPIVLEEIQLEEEVPKSENLSNEDIIKNVLQSASFFQL